VRSPRKAQRVECRLRRARRRMGTAITRPRRCRRCRRRDAGVPGCGGPVVMQVLPLPRRCQCSAPAAAWRRDLRRKAAKGDSTHRPVGAGRCSEMACTAPTLRLRSRWPRPPDDCSRRSVLRCYCGRACAGRARPDVERAACHALLLRGQRNPIAAVTCGLPRPALVLLTGLLRQPANRCEQLSAMAIGWRNARAKKRCVPEPARGACRLLVPTIRP